jgi:hypothetical protein
VIVSLLTLPKGPNPWAEPVATLSSRVVLAVLRDGWPNGDDRREATFCTRMRSTMPMLVMNGATLARRDEPHGVAVFVGLDAII